MPDATPLSARPANCTTEAHVCMNARNAAAEAVSTFVLPHRGHLCETERPRGYQLYPHPWQRLSGRLVKRLMGTSGEAAHFSVAVLPAALHTVILTFPP
jgi:hypothetical protein